MKKNERMHTYMKMARENTHDYHNGKMKLKYIQQKNGCVMVILIVCLKHTIIDN